MKTLTSILILALCLISLSSANAVEADTNRYVEIPTEVQKVLANKMFFPEEAKAKGIEGSITICFYITPKGRVVVNCVDGTPILKECVKENMENIQMPKKIACANRNMIVKYTFDLE